MKEVPNLYILCPVKDGMKYLDRYLSNLAPLGCSIIFLDQNSTDGTTEYLKELSSNTPNIHYFKNKSKEWDCGYNTSTLLELCKNFNPEWVMVLDVDETIHELHRIPALCEGSEKELIYSFSRLSMAGEDRYWPGMLVVERFFRYHPSFTISLRGLHRGCKPDQIGRAVHSGIQILHWNMVTEKDRRDRYEKFMKADPDLYWQPSYDNLLNVPSFTLPL